MDHQLDRRRDGCHPFGHFRSYLLSEALARLYHPVPGPLQHSQFIQLTWWHSHLAAWHFFHLRLALDISIYMLFRRQCACISFSSAAWYRPKSRDHSFFPIVSTVPGMESRLLFLQLLLDDGIIPMQYAVWTEKMLKCPRFRRRLLGALAQWYFVIFPPLGIL